MRQADSEIWPPRGNLGHILQCLSGRRRFIYDNEKFSCLHSGSLASLKLLSHLRPFQEFCLGLAFRC